MMACRLPPLFLLALLVVLGGCRAERDGSEEAIEFTIPSGASFSEVTDTLVAHDLVGVPVAFRAVARARGQDRQIRSGRYRASPDESWFSLLDRLVSGDTETIPVTIPEGFTIAQISQRLEPVTGETAGDILERLRLDGSHELWGVPGPNLEGFLFPDTYRFSPGMELEQVIRMMVERYRAVWTPERESRARELGMEQGQVMTLASIVQAEARHTSEMPRIAGVFHNRLDRGIPLQADPTVQYALEARRSRLMLSDIDSVADHPYNTYTRQGLPPGPIGAPGEAAIDAALNPETSSYLYFVARPDGHHIFSRTLAEHNRARVQARREWTAAGTLPGARNGG